MLTSLKNNSQRTAKNHKASMNMKLKNLQHSLSVAAMFAVALIPPTGAQAQWFTWAGTNSNPALAGNWSGTAPTFGAVNTSGLLDYGGYATLNYGVAQGTTTIGTSSGATYAGLSWIGYNGTATIQVSGGTLNLNGAFSNDGGTESVWFGNAGTGNLTVNGGTMNVLNGTIIGRGGSGMLSVANGTFTTGTFSSTAGVMLGGVSGATGTGTITIGNGGQFVLAAAVANPFIFGGSSTAGNANQTSCYLNFTPGSSGNITLNLSSATLGAAYYTNLIINGYVEIGGYWDTKPSDYVINTANLSAATLAVYYPPGPVITNQPVSQTTYSGQTNSFSIGVRDSGAVSYQWQAANSIGLNFTNLVNGGPVSGVTSNTLTIANVSNNWALAYQVIATDSSGSVTSAVVNLTVLTSVPMVNPNFDVDTIIANSGQYQVMTPTGWTAIGTNANNVVGLINPILGQGYTSTNGYSTPNALYCYSSDGALNPGVSQILTTTLNSNTSYTVSVQVGTRTNGTWGGYSVLLETTNGTVVGQWVTAYTCPAPVGTFATDAKTFTTGPNPSGLGQPLKLVLYLSQEAGGTYCDFDSVSIGNAPAITPHAQGAPIDVYLVSGQSNAQGWVANVASLSLSNAHYANAPDVRALSAYQCALAGATYYSTNSMGQLYPEGGGHSGNFAGFGPELSAGSDLAARFGRQMAIVKFASGGASLDTQFAKSANYLYPLLIGKITNSLAQLVAQGYTPTLKGFFWLQGETDAINTPANYYADIRTFISNLRTDLQVTNLEFVLTEINSNMPNLVPYLAGVSNVNYAMSSLTNTDPNVKYVRTEDITTGFGDGAIHYSADQNITIGQRWAAIYAVSTTNPPATPTNLVATAGNTQIVLSWNASANASGYNVKRSAEPTRWWGATSAAWRSRTRVW
jgi:hypothetical protein